MIDPKELRISNYVEFTPDPDPEASIQETYKDLEVLQKKGFNTYMKRMLKRDNTTHVYWAEINELSNFNIKVKIEDVILNTDISCISPIPLTEEWLLKCGFMIQDNTQSDKEYLKKYSSGRTVLNYKLVITKSCYKDSGEYRLFVIGNVSDGEICNIKYLHQLQNIYFALAGTELEVEL